MIEFASWTLLGPRRPVKNMLCDMKNTSACPFIMGMFDSISF
jgi:hypothetical protein